MQKTPLDLAPYRTRTYDDFCVTQCHMLTEFEDLSKTASQVLRKSGLASGAIAKLVQQFRSCDWRKRDDALQELYESQN